MQVIDAFLFSTELDLLDVRLHELSPVVDKFVLVEADHTFSGRDKPMVFAENRDRFAPFLDRITYVPVTMPPSLGPWGSEYYQRDAIERGLEGLASDDLLLISDVDEVPSADAVRRAAGTSVKLKFDQDFYFFFLNLRCVDQTWRGTAAIRYRDFSSAQQVRMQTDVQVLANGGWHFSWCGGVEAIQEKIRSFSHTEFDRPEINNTEWIAECLRTHQDVFKREPSYRYWPALVDQSYPRWLWQHREQFRHLFLPDTVFATEQGGAT